ncbi:MAG: enolase C-terminal domain-like protein [Candidatus Pacearchaeota archaeon]|jgi:enolase
MIQIRGISAKSILDTRKEKTIEVTIDTTSGKFIASAPNGKSRGKYETPSYKKSLNDDIQTLNKLKLKSISLSKFDDLTKIEKILKNKIGANSVIALEYAALKALAKNKNCEVWQLINPRAKNLPMSVGNSIEGGRHTNNIGPSFQEFHFIPHATSFQEAVLINKTARQDCLQILKNLDKKFKKQLSDENAWVTTLDEEKVMNLLLDVKDNMVDEFVTKVHCGIDLAASEFFNGKKYFYKNMKKSLNKEQQILFICEIADKFFYIEDPLEENDFQGFADIVKNSQSLIVGDDLTVTNLQRIKKAVKMNAIRGVIIKPNQCGSLIEVKQIVDFCKKNKIRTIFSHRSGETKENTLADLAFGFQADFIKTGVEGVGRDEKLDRLIEIEKSLWKI